MLVPPRRRDDVAAEVMFAIVRRGSGLVDDMVARNASLAGVHDIALGAAAAPPSLAALRLAADIGTSYVRHAIACTGISMQRKDRLKIDDTDPDRTPEPPPVEAADEYDRAREIVEMALEHVAVFKPDARETYEQLLALAFDEVTMSACAEREVRDGAAKDAKTARDKLQQRHRRLRVALCEALDWLESDDAIDAEAARLGRSFVERVLNRAPKRPPRR